MPQGGPDEVVLAGSCVAWLPLVGGGGAAQQGHQAAWRLLQLRIIGSLHLEMDALFEGVAEVPMVLGVDKSVHLSLPPVSETRPVARLQQLQRRVSNLCCYLASLLG